MVGEIDLRKIRIDRKEDLKEKKTVTKRKETPKLYCAISNANEPPKCFD